MNEEVCYYMIDGESLPLKRLYTARLVVPARHHVQRDVAARLARSNRLDRVTTIPGNLILVRGDTHELEKIHCHHDIYCTRSVFLDTHGQELFLTNELLVRFAEAVNDPARRDICRKFNCTVVNDTHDIWRIRVEDRDDDAPLDVANVLSAEPGVDFAEPNALQSAIYDTEPQSGNALPQHLSHLDHTGNIEDTISASIRTLEAWEITTGVPRMRIVVYDRDIYINDINDATLMSTVLSNNVDHHGDDASYTDRSQGTGDPQGAKNTRPRQRIASLRAAGFHTWAAWTQAFTWAAAHSDIISCSWRISRNRTLSEAIKKTVREGRGGKGSPVFCDTGYDHSRMNSFPAHLSETIVVGPSTKGDVRPPHNQASRHVDFVVPIHGETRYIEVIDVRKAIGHHPRHDGDDGKEPNAHGFCDLSSPVQMAAGVAALMLSVNNYLTAEQVRAILRDTCEKIDQAHANYNGRGWSTQYGYGRLNAAAAVKRAQDLLQPR